MSMWTAIVLIVLISAVAGIIRSRNRALSKMKQHENEQKLTNGQETERELKELRERVKVLERITVDGREARAIADEIESLRSKPDKQDG